MARPKKKKSDPKMSMEQLLNRAVTLFQEPYDERDERESSIPSLRTVADQLSTTILRTRKLLITAEYFSTGTSRMVQEICPTGISADTAPDCIRPSAYRVMLHCFHRAGALCQYRV